MKSILLDGKGKPASFLERNFAGAPYPEKWLQDLIFENRAVLPMEEIDPAAGDGMREDVQAIAGNLRGQGRLALVEFQIWTGAGERGPFAQHSLPDGGPPADRFGGAGLVDR